MKIIITNRFREKYLDKFSKYFSDIDFVENLKNKFHKFIFLERPFIKFKTNIKSTSIRWIVIIETWERIVPLCLFLKNNKNYWENIIWEDKKLRKLLFLEFEKNFTDLKEKKYELFL
jgi:hypothetical protein